jgi:hypothetical protein
LPENEKQEIKKKMVEKFFGTGGTKTSLGEPESPSIALDSVEKIIRALGELLGRR